MIVESVAAPPRAEVEALAARAREADGVDPLNEHSRLHLAGQPAAGAVHLLASDPAGTLLGYAFADGDRSLTADLVVDPPARGRGTGTALVRAVLERARDRPASLWAHGDHPAAATVAARTGLLRTRELRRMRRSLSEPLPPVQLPAGVTLRHWRDSDAEAWLDLNARAFADHPEQGSLDSDGLAVRTAQPWFDPVGFLLAERDGRLVGFHWTKVAGDEQPGVGEVYVVGVDPDAQGGGLGRALTLAGLHHLRDGRGLGLVDLYVDGDNAAAVAVYARLGFVTAAVDVAYTRR